MRKLAALMAVFILAIGLIVFVNLDGFLESANLAESRGALAGLVAAERAYHKEFGHYDADLTKIGFVPEDRLDSAIGFNPTCKGAQPMKRFESLFHLLPCPSQTNFVLMAVRENRKGALEVLVADRNGPAKFLTIVNSETRTLEDAIAQFPP